MNENAPLGGLARQLVQVGQLDEKTAQQAQLQAQRNQVSLVTWLVQNKLVKSRAVVDVAGEQFGVPYFDLSAVDKETQPQDLVSEKLVRQHRALPLQRRGNKLYVAVSDPTNHQAISDIQFNTGLSVEAVLVEDDKLGQAIEKFFESASTTLDGLSDSDLDDLDVELSGGKEEEGEHNEADDAPVVRLVNKM